MDGVALSFHIQRRQTSAASFIAAVATSAGFRGRMAGLAFGFLRMPQPRAAAIKRLGLVQRDGFARVKEREVRAIRLFLVELICLVADGVAFAALHAVPVIVEHFLEWTEIDDSLIFFQARPLFAFEGLDRNGTELDSFDRLPGLIIPVQDLYAVETGLGESS